MSVQTECKRVNIIHLTSVHARYDTRVFVKECCSLATVPEYNVILIVADGKGDEVRDRVTIIDVGKPSGRLQRMVVTARKVAQKALEFEGHLCHLHDPELLPYVSRFKKAGARVVYDAHEDLPRQVMAKSYLPQWSRLMVSQLSEFFENRILDRCDALVVPTEKIAGRFAAAGMKSIMVRNFPKLEEFSRETAWKERQNSICYIGTIGRSRGIEELVRSAELSNTVLELSGTFKPIGLLPQISARTGWKKVVYHGMVDRAAIQGILARCKVGLVTLHPTSSYVDALPVKMFEYMAAGIPVIASDFPLWQKIVVENQCGLCVDPLNPRAIADAIRWLLDHPSEAERMGKEGRKAVLSRYNWAHEERELLQLYHELLKGGAA